MLSCFDSNSYRSLLLAATVVHSVVDRIEYFAMCCMTSVCAFLLFVANPFLGIKRSRFLGFISSDSVHGSAIIHQASYPLCFMRFAVVLVIKCVLENLC